MSCCYLSSASADKPFSYGDFVATSACVVVSECIKSKDKNDRCVPCAAGDVDNLCYSESLRLEHSRAAEG